MYVLSTQNCNCDADAKLRRQRAMVRVRGRVGVRPGLELGARIRLERFMVVRVRLARFRLIRVRDYGSCLVLVGKIRLGSG